MAGQAIDGGFWEISTASHIDWPIQSRIIEIAASPEAQQAGEFGGASGPATISIFTTMVDIDAPLSHEPASWTRIHQCPNSWPKT